MQTLDRTRDILRDLIAFPTISSDGNLELVAYAAELLSNAGARLSIARDETGAKANIFATLGPEGDGGIILSGHTDVVPVEGQDWTTDPFSMTERDGLLFGRGACDMKGFVAACLAMAPRFAEVELTRPLHFALTYDEEIGCFGARALVREIAAMGIRPAIAIIGEPTGMGVVEGHKGCYEYTTEFAGLEGHGSNPDRGVNAVEYAARFASRLLELRDSLKQRASPTSRFDPPWPTLQIGRMTGGAARNIIAGQCTVEWEIRPIRISDADFVKHEIDAYVADTLLPAMREVYPEASIVTHVIGEVEGLAVEDQSEARDLALSLTGEPGATMVPFGTEAGLFQSAGISAVICGPGSIAQAHRPDEFIAVDQLASCIGMLERLRHEMSR